MMRSITAGDARESRRDLGPRDHRAHLAAVDTVAQVGVGQQGGGRDHHRAELHRRQRRLPQLDLIAEQHQHSRAAPHALLAQPAGELAGARRSSAKV